MKDDLLHVSEDMIKAAKLLAMIVRNSMEDFHAEHLSDAQMKELNPIIRNAILNGLHALGNQSDMRVQRFLEFHEMVIPSYWEEPRLTDEYISNLKAFDKEGNYIGSIS
jgi:hypothetical protein